MKPYDKLTIVRNRQRERDLRIFRERVETYFEQFEYDADDLPVDWEGVRTARSQINRMLPRIIEVVEAADLGVSAVTATHTGPAGTPGEVLHNIFSARYADGECQEILDVIDMALGVYEASRFNALARTFNPLHYVMTTLGFVAGLPRQLFKALGFRMPRLRAARIQPEDVNRLEAAVSRLTSVEELIEVRFAEMRDWQTHQIADSTSQLTELAERLDFAERVLAQPRPADRIESPDKKDAVTPA